MQKNTTETQRITERIAPSPCPSLVAPKPLFLTGGSFHNLTLSVVLCVSVVFSGRPMIAHHKPIKSRVSAVDLLLIRDRAAGCPEAAPHEELLEHRLGGGLRIVPTRVVEDTALPMRLDP